MYYKKKSGCFRKSSNTNARGCQDLQWKNNSLFFLDSEKICKHLITVLQCSYATVKRIIYIKHIKRIQPNCLWQLFFLASSWFADIFFLYISIQTNDTIQLVGLENWRTLFFPLAMLLGFWVLVRHLIVFHNKGMRDCK